jgi:hypothetical protein
MRCNTGTGISWVPVVGIVARDSYEGELVVCVNMTAP